MSEPFIGEIVMFAGNFAPRGWAFCNGQLLPIAQNTALFSILGTTYGGDGRVTFALPDLRGRVPLHWGNSTGPGLSSYALGEMGGTQSVTLISTQMPMHTHLAAATVSLPVSTGDAASAQPSNTSVLAKSIDAAGIGADPAIYAPAAAADASLAPVNAPVQVGMAGGSQPHENRQPFLAVNFIIALQGIFPSRN